MANILFLVFLMSVSVALTRECTKRNIKCCDDCIRCGNEWCYSSKGAYCISNGSGETCPGRIEKLTTIEEDVSASIPINKMHKQPISSTTFEAKFEIQNSTQTDNVYTRLSKPQCSASNINECRFTIDVRPSDDFCTDNSTTVEFFDLKVNLGAVDSHSFRYHVPCSCNCSNTVEENSRICNRRGDYSCGVCTCRRGWEGGFCEKEICERGRGDIPICSTDEECHGNGECSCGICKCFGHLEGEQYFDDKCKDICSTTQESYSCLLHPDFEKPCESTDGPSLYFTPYNETMLEEYDSSQRRVWVNCNRTFDNCVLQYAAAMINKDIDMSVHNVYTIMITKSCDPETAPAASAALPIALPVVLGLIALLGSIAAVAGYLFWKNRSPPLPLSDPQYQNIDADFSQGENPLYKCPTSNFKNPTYGKW